MLPACYELNICLQKTYDMLKPESQHHWTYDNL